MFIFSNSVDELERSSSPGLQRFWNSGRGADCLVDDLSGYFAGRFGHERLRDDREMTRNRTVAHLNAALRSVKYSSKVQVLIRYQQMKSDEGNHTRETN